MRLYRSLTQRDYLDFVIIFCCYAGMHALYNSGLIVTFQSEVITQTHYLDPVWLKKDLLQSLWLMHAQPPLMNFIFGIISKAPPGYFSLIFSSFYFLAGIASIVFLYLTMYLLSLHRILRLAICLWICIAPTFFWYQAWYYAPHLEFCLCAAAMYYLACFYTQDHMRKKAFIKLFIVCCLLGLIRAQWHVFLFFGLAGLMWLMEKGELRRQIIMLSVLCLFPLIGWYTKNAVMYGFWGASSWMGGNLAQIVSHTVKPKELADMRMAGTVSPFFAPHFQIEKILNYLPAKPDNISHVSLGPYKKGKIRNLNYIGIIPYAKQNLHDAIAIIQRYPSRYIKEVLRLMWDNSWKPALRRRSQLHTPIFKKIVPPSQVFLWQWGAFLLYACTPLCLLMLWLKRGSDTIFAAGWQPFFAATFYIALGMYMISCMFNGQEQERMRWGQAPIYLCYAAMLMEAGYAWLSAFLASRPLKAGYAPARAVC